MVFDVSSDQKLNYSETSRVNIVRSPPHICPELKFRHFWKKFKNL
jgi:hypothetical protein